MASFSWIRAVEINRTALLGVVAFLVRLMAPGEAEGTVFLATRKRRFLFRLLVPAESAARRLIFLHMMVTERTASTRKPTGWNRSAIIPRNDEKTSIPPFRLVDPRKRMDWSIFSPEPVTPTNNRTNPVEAKNPEPVCCTDIWRRTKALEAAISDLDRSAQRMAGAEARRQNAKPGPACLSPIRHGKPPGHRQKPVHDVDHVLRESHALAADCLYAPP